MKHRTKSFTSIDDIKQNLVVIRCSVYVYIYIYIYEQIVLSF